MMSACLKQLTKKLRNLKNNLSLKSFIVCFIALIFCSGWIKQQCFVCFNNRPITGETILQPVSTFKSGEKIYYMFFSKKRLKNDFIRVQVFKTGDNIAHGGYEMARVKDYRLMKDEVYYQTDYFVLHQPGRYILQVYDPQKLNLPLANGEFLVK